MRRLVRRALRCTLALSMAVLLSAHVGSPDVYYSGNAGPYAIDVAVRPPEVVPGIAKVTVTVADSSVASVVIRPVFWRAGAKGAPAGDSLSRVRGSSDTYAGELWLMASGSYSVHVSVAGPAGSGTVIVPVASVATGQLALSPFLKALLGVLGALLVGGVVTAVYAAIGESQLPPGEPVTPTVRRRARRGALIAVPGLALVLLGGANWWNAEAVRYRRTLYRPIPTRSSVRMMDGVATLVLSVADSGWRAGNVTPLMPDHGRLAHMFLVRADSPVVFAHLHPDMLDRSTFTTVLPPLPGGRYRIFTDVVHESGFQRTFVDSVTIASAIDSAGLPELTADDAWSLSTMVMVRGTMAEIRGHDGNVYMRFAGSAHIVVGQPGVLRIGLSDRKGEPLLVEPYLGMLGHAAVVRDDGRVFVHLHQSGTSSMASSMAFAMRDRGDTTADGRLRIDSAAMQHAAPPVSLREIRFPYAFPSPGRYRIFVQVRLAGDIHTTGFDVLVHER